MRARRAQDKAQAARERDARTVFVTLSTKADDRAVFKFFSEVGKVTDVRIITDRYQRPKGFAYVEMAEAAGVSAALALSGSPLLGQAVSVKASESEKNDAWASRMSHGVGQGAAPLGARGPGMPAPPPGAGAGGPPGLGSGVDTIMGAGVGIGGLFRVELKNLHGKITAADVRAVCEPFGAVARVDVADDESSPGCNKSMVFFTSASDGERAAAQLDGMELVGRKVKAETVPMEPHPPGQPAGAGAAASAVPVPIGVVNEIDDDRGLKMNAQGRAVLMQRLAGKLKGEDAEAVAAPTAVLMPPRPPPAPQQAGAAAPRQGVLGPASPVPTPCLLLSNLFDPAQETGECWDQEIADDVREECEAKCGRVAHIHVHRDSPGDVYVCFREQAAAERAHKMMSGRWFAARQVSSSFQFAPLYAEHFQL